MFMRTGKRLSRAVAVAWIIGAGLVSKASAECANTSQPSARAGCAGQSMPVTVPKERADTRLTGKGWIGEQWQSQPFMLQPSTPTYTVRTSLAHLFAYGQHRQRERDRLIQEGLTPGQAAALTQASPLRPPVDLWTALDFDRVSDDGLVRGGFGADLTLTKGTVIGLAVERGKLTNGDDERVLTYFKRRIATGLTWSLYGGVGQGLIETSGSAGAIENGYLNARVEKDLSVDGLKIAPSMEVATHIGRLDHGAEDRSWSRSEVILKNRVSRAFDVDERMKLEPFLVITQSIDAADGSDAGQGVESGLKIDTLSQLSLSASTAVKSSETAGEPELSGKVHLKLPFN